jgi:hypothetical protein
MRVNINGQVLEIRDVGVENGFVDKLYKMGKLPKFNRPGLRELRFEYNGKTRSEYLRPEQYKEMQDY